MKEIQFYNVFFKPNASYVEKYLCKNIDLSNFLEDVPLKIKILIEENNINVLDIIKDSIIEVILIKNDSYIMGYETFMNKKL
jgi:hypothetical protein